MERAFYSATTTSFAIADTDKYTFSGDKEGNLSGSYVVTVTLKNPKIHKWTGAILNPMLYSGW